MSFNNINSSFENTIVPIPSFRRQTTTPANDCYHCGSRAETKEVEYRCWNCNKFATPLTAHASWEAFQRKGIGPVYDRSVSWYVWTRRWNNLPNKTNLSPYWAQKLRIKKMEDLINIW